MARKGTSNIRATKTTIDGIEFASKFESQRYIELKLLEKAKEIYHLKTHVSFPLERGEVRVTEMRGNKVRIYTVDFAYLEPKLGESGGWQRVVEDTKGVRTGESSLRMSIFKALYPEIELRVIKQRRLRRR